MRRSRRPRARAAAGDDSPKADASPESARKKSRQRNRWARRGGASAGPPLLCMALVLDAAYSGLLLGLSLPLGPLLASTTWAVRGLPKSGFELGLWCAAHYLGRLLGLTALRVCEPLLSGPKGGPAWRQQASSWGPSWGPSWASPGRAGRAHRVTFADPELSQATLLAGSCDALTGDGRGGGLSLAGLSLAGLSLAGRLGAAAFGSLGLSFFLILATRSCIRR